MMVDPRAAGKAAWMVASLAALTAVKKAVQRESRSVELMADWMVGSLGYYWADLTVV